MGLTQEKFGELCGVGPLTVSLWEKGDRKPSKAAQIILNSLAKANETN